MTAKKLKTMGYCVIAGCLSDSSEGAEEMKKEGIDLVIKCNVTKDEDVDNFVQQADILAEKTNKRIWAVVNNAGIAPLSFIDWCPMESAAVCMEVRLLLVDTK